MDASISTRLAEQLYDQPDLEEQLTQLQKRLSSEQSRRVEYYEWLDEDKKAEFINGEIFVHSPVVKRHADTTKMLTKLLDTYVELGQLGYVATEKILVQLRRNDFEPDVAFWRADKAEAFEEDQLFFPAPDLVIEVLSPSTEINNRTVKYKAYANNGVAEYWIVDSAKRTVERFNLVGNAYRVEQVLLEDEELTSTVIEGFRIPVAAIFNRQVSLETLRQMLTAGLA